MPSPVCSAISTSNLPWFMGLTFQVPMQFLFTASDFTSNNCHVHNWALFSLWLCLFFVELFLHSSPAAYWAPNDLGFIFQCHIFLPFHTVHGPLKARILKGFAFLFSSEPHFVKTLHDDLSILGCPTQHDSWFHWVRQGCGPCDQFGSFSVIVVFTVSAFWWRRIWGLWKLPDGRDWLGETWSCTDRQDHA